MQWFKSLSALVVVVLLVGCVQAPKKQAFNREAATHVKTVVVARADNQDSYEAAVLGHPGASFGLIGGLIAMADTQSKTTRLTTAIDPKETRLQERFGTKLSDGLAAAGYQATVVVLPKDTPDEQVLSVVKQKASGDAIVSVALFGGYWAAGPSTDYFPRVLARVRALDAASGAVLYEDTITFGYAAARAQTVHLASDPKYQFGNMDALVADPVKTREGLYSGVDAVVAQIVADLKRN